MEQTTEGWFGQKTIKYSHIDPEGRPIANPEEIKGFDAEIVREYGNKHKIKHRKRTLR